ncbi:hypothetical protein QBC35DRAFT_234990 [Podospora australis]|uniref:Fungal STAND N-terminal Goodbye domain-containing protein n=1 Tax=Podospora australis TaxID=1536484 RepID=A0AAN7AIZ3_9PEZI|nr:hypothetical protein QBC35DRAFT_234990 [Podospora australis]
MESQSIVEQYLRDRGRAMEQVHEAFAVKPPGSEMAQPTSEQRKSEFLQALREFNAYLDDVSKNVQVDFDLKKCGWPDVLEKLKDADGAIAKRMERDKTFWSKGARWLTDMSSLFQPGLQAIPDEFCFIHGGLALLIHLAKSRDKAKRDIVLAFEDVTETIAMAGSVAEHVEDPRLFDALDTLRIDLFRTIPQLINLLLPKRIVAKLSAPLRTPKVEALLETLCDSSNRVKARAQTLSNMHHSEAAKITKDHVEGIHDGVRGLHQMQQHIWDMVSSALASQDGMKKMLHEAVETFQHYNSQPRGSSVTSLPSSPVSSASDNHFKLSVLRTLLNVKQGHEEQDLAYVRRQDSEFDTKSKSAAAQVFVNPNFQRWMTTCDPDIVHIEGRLERLHGKTSPISYFCAGLVEAFKTQPTATVVLHFFCGQHVSSNDQLRGPQGLMRSLTVQALRAWPMVSLEGLHLGAFERNYESMPLEYLCDLFKLVVGQVPTSYTVYCIIDDISWLEREDWIEDYWGIMTMLQHLVKGDFSDARFKVLLTSPGRSKWLRGERDVGDHRKIMVTDSGLPLRDRRFFGR